MSDATHDLIARLERIERHPGWRERAQRWLVSPRAGTIDGICWCSFCDEPHSFNRRPPSLKVGDTP